MPLGKNLKKDTLIPTEKKEKEPVAKKTIVSQAKKKPAKKVEKPKAEKITKASPPKKVAQKKSQPKTEPKKVVAIEKKQELKSVSLPTPNELEEKQLSATAINEIDQVEDAESIDTDEVPAVILPTERQHVTAPKAQAQELLRKKIGTVKYLTEEEYQEKKRLKEKFDQEIKAYAGKDVQLIVFKMGQERYAIEIDRVREVVHTPRISKIPHAPNFIKGVSNVRGSVMVVLDLGLKFGIDNQEESKEFILVIHHDEFKAGILVNEVPLTVKVAGDNIVSSAGILRNTSLDETYIKGIIKTDEDMIIFIDIAELIQEDEVSIISQSILG
ncbi:chemotaxis protein CheW [Reichenbachiella agarivorans]|uniref:Chemotaxis protein CheW n=1 Tax=Reichenbachiella agarivorans TaxID=2979464 RepID=A0ABY6CS30_9BACT|nr:chemotaxis protein CheW [Reichenbachiella agarivorans]UXP31095.1 chemotaxis protein CheW [Reichenbachiella agarivorans]